MERFRRGARAGGALSGETLLPQIILRTVFIVAMMAALLAAFMWIAARKADDLSIERQQKLIATVIEQNFRSIAHDQEAATVWDDAVVEMRRRPIDKMWIDANLGLWFYSYYGHDEVYIVDPRGQPIYAMQSGNRADPVPDVPGRELIAELREKMRAGGRAPRAGPALTPGAIDLGIVNGHPAIVSAKPIVSDTGDLPTPPGLEYVHVSVRYLDGSFAADLAQRYQLENAHFDRERAADSDVSEVALRNRAGASIGYFMWDPYRPGTVMLGRVAPALAVSLLIVSAIVAWLLRRIGRNTIQLSVARSRAQHLADHDPLTGLANRALFDRRLSSGLLEATITNGALALLYVDLDHFKNVNDHLGHPTGDQLIRTLAQTLTDLAPGDLVARLGGDEFAIIHRSDNVSATGEQLARSIHRALARPLDLGGGEVLIGASIGVALAPQDGIDPVDLVRKADIALYDAKRSGRRRHSFYTAAMGDQIRDRSEIESDLREAMRTGTGLDVVYQPYFAARSGELLGAEAFVRWEHPQRGAVSPDRFIPIAEECGLIETLSEWVLEQACATAARWRTGTISVNLAAPQLRNPALAERVYAVLKRTRLSPDRLELEITETSFIDSSAQCRSNLGWLRDIGVRIALADFGTGYSSFRHLRGFEVDRIKIDRSFVATIKPGQAGSPVIQAIADLARLSGLETTAEGVETEQQLLLLTSIGCDAVQGFLLAEPLDAAGLEARFRAMLHQ